jgi:hypothetical protein
MDAFQAWLDAQEIRGFSPASISNLCKAFVEGHAPADKLTRFGQLVQQFCERASLLPVPDSRPDPGARLYGSTWYLYLFHPLPPNESVAVYGRAVLQIHEGPAAAIRNIPDGHTPNYSGTWRIFGGDLLVFDFSSAADRAHLHIKVNYNPDQPEFDIMLGAFVSNGRGYLSAGTLVFEKIAPEAAGAAEPQYFTYNRNAAHFHQTQPAIRKYLKSRSLNYLRIPGRVFLKKTLNDAREGLPAWPHTRFIEDGQLQVYLAAPTYSVDAQRYEAVFGQLQSLEELLKQAFGSQISVQFNGFRTADALRLAYQQVLGRIRQTTLFCLIYLDRAPSNALIELGMAYAQAKYIRIFTTREAMLNNGFLSSGAGSHPVSGAAGQQMPFVQIVEFDHEDLDEAFRQVRLHLSSCIQALLHQDP